MIPYASRFFPWEDEMGEDKMGEDKTEAALAKPRLASLSEHFSRIGDDREPWRVVYALPEVLLLVVCATIAGCDDDDEIADWGEAHLSLSSGPFGVLSRGALRGLAAQPDEPDRPGPVLAPALPLG